MNGPGSTVAADTSPNADARGAVAQSAADRLSQRSLRRLHLALQRITESLAGELARPSVVLPNWSASEWAVARAVAAIHGISSLLADALRWQGPPGWTRFLAEQKAHTAQRFLRIQQLLQLIDGGARSQGIALTGLKGAALHAAGIYVAGERPMADVDLLVREAQLARAAQLLAGLGYRHRYQTWKHQVFERDDPDAPAALGEHAGNGIKIELHCHIREALPLRAVDISDVVFPLRPVPGLNPYPSKAALLLHLLLHAAGALTSRELRLLQLHDVARLAGTMTDEDWEQLLCNAARTAEADRWWAFPALALADRYYGCVPERVLCSAARRCPWVLQRVYRRRTLAGASLSHLWISALPGIEWSHSSLAMLQYAAARLLPSCETLQQRKALGILQPHVSGGAWTQLSQGRRILRWLGSPQARHATLQPVIASLRATY
jgi:hypothetical protein